MGIVTSFTIDIWNPVFSFYMKINFYLIIRHHPCLGHVATCRKFQFSITKSVRLIRKSSLSFCLSNRTDFHFYHLVADEIWNMTKFQSAKSSKNRSELIRLESEQECQASKSHPRSKHIKSPSWSPSLLPQTAQLVSAYWVGQSTASNPIHGTPQRQTSTSPELIRPPIAESILLKALLKD